MREGTDGRVVHVTVGRVIVLAAWLCASIAPTPGASSVVWSVAVTIDDLPMSAGAGCDPDEVARVNARLLETLDSFRVRATAFAVPGGPCQAHGEGGTSAMALRWRSAGHEIGNHSFMHPDFNTMEADDYLADVQRAHEALEPVITQTGQATRWFRAPMLHTGATPAKKAALDRWLTTRGYRHGVVTIDNQEWVYATAYARAQARKDAPLADRVVAAYVQHLRDCAAYFRKVARTLFGREIPQVLLLHVNRLNADHLADVLRAFEEDGARWIPLAGALADQAYGTPDRFVGSRGLSWLLRWAHDRGVPVGPEPREAAWVARAARP